MKMQNLFQHWACKNLPGERITMAFNLSKQSKIRLYARSCYTAYERK